MALTAQQANERRRVKVYELKNNDWYDRGTGFCAGQVMGGPNAIPENPVAHLIVQSEDDPERLLLDTRITKDDGYQKQQETLVVWTESNGVDMALSFQEAEGCATIWDFVSEIQGRLAALAPDDNLSDDILDQGNGVILPEPQLGKLEDVENALRAAASTLPTRDALLKYIMHPEQPYILKLAPLLELAEEKESLPDLHKLCTIMKYLILLNDTSIIEYVVTDQAIMAVVGALEYDGDFPSHRANHRQYLSDSSKFKEVVKIDDVNIRKKIHCTYRLLYLKDVVLARILDDPTFGVLNSLIFFHQVDIVNHIQNNQTFLHELFMIFGPSEQDPIRKKEAVLFIQNCCAVSKNIQAQSRAQLYHHFIQHGLFPVVVFALRHRDPAVRVAGTDILVALIDHDPQMVRAHVFNAIKEKAVPLTDVLIELLLIEVDLGVKSQMADAIKILLDPSTNQAQMEMMHRAQNGDFVTKGRGPGGHPQNNLLPQTEQFISSFYDDSAKRLFQPLKDLEHRTSMTGLTVMETSLYTHLVEILCFFVRQHSYKSKLFVLTENLHCRIAQLLECPQKYMKLTALKWFRACIQLQDEFHNRQLIQHRLFEPILNIVYETMPRDNLLNSACLELFEHIKRESIKQLIHHLVENYRDRLMAITYVNTFQALVSRHEQLQAGYQGDGNEESFTTQEGTPQRNINGGPQFAGLKEVDPDEEAYFNGDDDDDDEDGGLPTSASAKVLTNGASPVRPLVNYPDDEDDAMDILASSPDQMKDKKSSSSDPTTGNSDPDSLQEPAQAEHERGRDRRPVPVEDSPGYQSPPDSLAMKRRREEEDEDELGKLMGGGVKRRNSSASVSSRLNVATIKDEEGARNTQSPDPLNDNSNGQVSNGQVLKRKGSLKTKNEGPVSRFAFKIQPVRIEQKEARNGGDESGGGGG